MRPWWLPVVDPHGGGCLSCPPTTRSLPDGAAIAVGFGDAVVTRGGEVIYSEHRDWGAKGYMTAGEAARLADADPEHDWRIDMQGPLRGRTYQRQDGAWVLVAQNEGFA